MVQQVKSALRDLWEKFVDSFVGAAATSLLVGAGALVTGIYEKIHLIDEIAARQVKIEERLETRDKAILDTQERLKEADAKMAEKMAGFSAEHSIILRRLGSPRASEGKIR